MMVLEHDGTVLATGNPISAISTAVNASITLTTALDVRVGVGDTITVTSGGAFIGEYTIAGISDDRLSVVTTRDTSTFGAFTGTTSYQFTYAEVYPADRCRWNSSYNGNNYVVHEATFYPGGGTGQALINPRLGFIGKSGRFVEIAR